MMLAGSSALALLGQNPWGQSAWAQNATAAPRETDWLHYANDLSSTRYSSLDQINAANFNNLELAWRFSTNALGPRLDADYQSTPLVVKGRIYVTAGFRRDDRGPIHVGLRRCQSQERERGREERDRSGEPQVCLP